VRDRIAQGPCATTTRLGLRPRPNRTYAGSDTRGDWRGPVGVARKRQAPPPGVVRVPERDVSHTRAHTCTSRDISNSSSCEFGMGHGYSKQYKAWSLIVYVCAIVLCPDTLIYCMINVYVSYVLWYMWFSTPTRNGNGLAEESGPRERAERGNARPP
jgi:hypothetical protein